MKKFIQYFVNFRNKLVEQESEFERKIHLQQIKQFGKKREKLNKAVLNLKGKILKDFEDYLLIRFSSNKEIFTDIKSQDIVLIVDNNFYKNLKLPIEKLYKITQNYPLGTIDAIGKKFIDLRVYKPFDNKFLKNIDLQLFVNDIFFRRQLEALKDFEKIKNKKIQILILLAFYYQFYYSKNLKEFENFLQKVLNYFIQQTPAQINVTKDFTTEIIKEVDKVDKLSRQKNKKQIKSDNKVEKIAEEAVSKLNKEQKEFVSLAKTENWNGLVLHGPFGTGKTTTLVATIISLANKGKKILVSANSNIAVDNIVEKLTESIPEKIVRIGPISRARGDKLRNFNLFSILQHHSGYSQIHKIEKEIENLKKLQKKYLKPTPALRRGLTDKQILKLASERKPYRGLSRKQIISLANRIEIEAKIQKFFTQKEEIKNNILNKILEEKNIILTTHAMTFSEILKGKNFDIVIIDEGSQATFPGTLCSLVKGEKFIIAGDHKQLPPTILSNNKILETSFFEAMINLENFMKNEKLNNKFQIFSTMLMTQYRMCKQLMNFPNKLFYNGKLKAFYDTKNFKFSNKKDFLTKQDFNFLYTESPASKKIYGDKCLFRIDLVGEQKIDNETKSLYNLAEIKAVKKIIKLLLNENQREENIGIISPYAAQVRKIKEMLKNMELEIEVATIDGFQGREKEIIIISRVRNSNIGFLIDERRFNVAITRAKKLLVNIGNLENLAKGTYFFKEYKKFLTEISRK